MNADYLAVLDDTTKTIDFSAWANVKNATGATFDDAELTLIGGAASQHVAPPRFAIAKPVRLGHGETVQVELIPPRLGAKTRSVIVFEAMADRPAEFQAAPATECAQNGASTAARTEIALEVDVPTTTALPDGRARVFRRIGGRLDVVNEDTLRSIPGIARIRYRPIPGHRRARRFPRRSARRACARRPRKDRDQLENKSKQAVDVVIREALWRWSVWRIEAEDAKGVRTQMQDYRLPAGSNRR